MFTAQNMPGMDVVYVLGTGSTWQDNELRYSLRSVEKYLQGYGKVYVIGKCPDWLGNVIHIPCEDIQGRKELSIMNKVLVACNNEHITSDFLFFNDDHFLLQPLAIDQIKYWSCGTLMDRVLNNDGSTQIKAKNTVDAIGDGHFFDIHVPIIYNKEKFQHAVSDPRLDWNQKDYSLKSVYGNLCKVESTFMRDLKISFRKSGHEINHLLKGRVWFSLGIAGTKRVMKEKLQSLYPDRSKYEINEPGSYSDPLPQ